jgi:hypothetical protein
MEIVAAGGAGAQRGACRVATTTRVLSRTLTKTEVLPAGTGRMTESTFTKVGRPGLTESQPLELKYGETPGARSDSGSAVTRTRANVVLLVLLTLTVNGTKKLLCRTVMQLPSRVTVSAASAVPDRDTNDARPSVPKERLDRSKTVVAIKNFPAWMLAAATASRQKQQLRFS